MKLIPSNKLINLLKRKWIYPRQAKIGQIIYYINNNEEYHCYKITAYCVGKKMLEDEEEVGFPLVRDYAFWIL